MDRPGRVDDVMLMAYVDGEVDAATAREIERAIAADEALFARTQALRETAGVARAAFSDALHEPVPRRLLDAIERAPTAAVAAIEAPARASRVVAFPSARRPTRQAIGWALAASFAVAAVGLGGLYSMGRLPSPSGLQFASGDRWLDHVAGFYTLYSGTLTREERMLVDFGSDSIPELEKWFGNKLQRQLSVPDLSAQGYTIQGGRLLIISGRPAAQFIYNSTAGDLVGLVIAFTDESNQEARAEARGDVNLVHWRKAGYAYAFAGRIPMDGLQSLATHAWRALDTI